MHNLKVVPSLLLMSLLGCGSRTPLPLDDVDACNELGRVQSCHNDCGDGTRMCVDFRLTPCTVPVAERSCDNICGGGSQSCRDGAWSACDVPVATRECSTVCGKGHETCARGQWAGCDAPKPGPPQLKATVRDFNDTHPDFERDTGSVLDLNIVGPQLSSDDKPIYASASSTRSTTGKMFFDQWYRDVPSVNQTTTTTITLTPSPANANVFNYDNDAFFPIDGQLFGNQGRRHNYDFTVELATEFRYVGGETFRFSGDDDLFVFINKTLAINLGGIHQALSGAVDLDKDSAKLGITKGSIYPFHLFFAERHVVSSTFHIQTSIAEFANCD